jgi:hypothetical protein
MVASKFQRAVVVSQRAREWIDKLGRLETVFTLASSGYCFVHWLRTDSFSPHIFLGALACGTIAAATIAWVTDRVRSTPSDQCYGSH